MFFLCRSRHALTQNFRWREADRARTILQVSILTRLASIERLATLSIGGLPSSLLPFFPSSIPFCNTVPHSSLPSLLPNPPRNSTEIIHNLIDITSKNGAYLLNIGPNSSGSILPVVQNTLRQVGDWLSINGRAIYSTVRPPARPEGLRDIENRKLITCYPFIWLLKKRCPSPSYRL
jgi:hypothetical protein